MTLETIRRFLCGADGVRTVSLRGLPSSGAASLQSSQHQRRPSSSYAGTQSCLTHQAGQISLFCSSQNRIHSPTPTSRPQPKDPHSFPGHPPVHHGCAPTSEALLPLPKPEQGSLAICLSLPPLCSQSALLCALCPLARCTSSLELFISQQGREAPTGRGQTGLVFGPSTWRSACLREVASQTCVRWTNGQSCPRN